MNLHNELESIVKAALKRIIDMGIVPGNAMIVGSGEELLCRCFEGYEDLGGRHSVSGETLWRMYSMTKPVIAVAALQLIEMGRLSLEDRLDRFLPGYCSAAVLDSDGFLRPAERPITIRHLMTMTSGMGYDEPAPQIADFAGRCLRDREAGHPWDTQRMAAEFAAVPLLFQPGERYCYGFSYDVLAAVIEIASGMPLNVWCQQNIFLPLKMEHTGFDVDLLSGSLAEGVREGPDGLQPADSVGGALVDLAQFSAPNWYSGGAGLVGTLDDYARFAAMLANGGELGGTRILGRGMVEMMSSPLLSPMQRVWYNDPAADPCIMGPAYSYGMGVRVCDRADLPPCRNVGEWGWAGAMGTWLSIDPKHGTYFVYAHQHTPSDHSRYVPLLMDAVCGKEAKKSSD